MLAEVERLHDAVTDLYAAAHAALSPEDVQELLLVTLRETARLAALRADAVAVWDRQRVWAGNGALSPSARLSREARCSFGTARVEVARARQLRHMPHTAAPLATGSINTDHVRLLSHARQPGREAAFARDEAFLVEHCQELSFPDAQRVVDYWCQRVDAVGVEAEAAELSEEAKLHVSTTFEGQVAVDGVLDPVGGEVVKREIDRLERVLYLADKQSGRTRTVGQRRAAALVEMARRSAAKPKGAKNARVLFSAYVGEATLERLCELGTGRVIAPGQLLPWLEVADLESILFDGPTTVVSVSKQRCFSGAVRRAVRARDRRCQHRSGCETPADDCDIDHVIAHRHGGATSQFAGKVECRPHNRDAAKHDHGTRPLPERTVTRDDEAAARRRWQRLHGTDHEPDW